MRPTRAARAADVVLGALEAFVLGGMLRPDSGPRPSPQCGRRPPAARRRPQGPLSWSLVVVFARRCAMLLIGSGRAHRGRLARWGRAQVCGPSRRRRCWAHCGRWRGVDPRRARGRTAVGALMEAGRWPSATIGFPRRGRRRPRAATIDLIAGNCVGPTLAWLARRWTT